MDGSSTIVSASSSNQDDIAICVWVHKKEISKARLQRWTLGTIFHAIVRITMVLATVAFLHQHLSFNWLPLKRAWPKATRHELVVPSVQKRGRDLKPAWHSDQLNANDAGELRSAYAEIQGLKLLVEQMRQAEVPRKPERRRNGAKKNGEKEAISL